MTSDTCVWRVTVEGDRGFLKGEVSLPGLDCERCTAWGTGRLLFLDRESAISIASVLPRSPSPLPQSEFMSLINRIVSLGIRCPISTSGHLNGFLPGDTFSPFSWEEKPRDIMELEPFFQLGNLAFIVRGERLVSKIFESKIQLKGVWIAPIPDKYETWGFLIDDRRERLANDGLCREACPLCGRLDDAKSPEQKRGLGILRSSMLKRKALAKEMVPDRDIFVTDYIHSWFVKRNVLDLLGQELSVNKSVTLEKWSIVG